MESHAWIGGGFLPGVSGDPCGDHVNAKTSAFPFVNQTNLTSVSTIVLSLTTRDFMPKHYLAYGYSQNSARSSTQVEIA